MLAFKSIPATVLPAGFSWGDNVVMSSGLLQLFYIKKRMLTFRSVQSTLLAKDNYKGVIYLFMFMDINFLNPASCELIYAHVLQGHEQDDQ